MNKVLLPTVCVAVLSTVAFEETVFADQKNSGENALHSETKYVNIKSGFLNLRETPSTNATVLATLIKGTEVTVYSEANGWSKVKAAGKEGYVRSSYLSLGNQSVSPAKTESAKITKKYVNVKSSSLNLRSNPSTSSQVITSLKKGMEVTVYSEANGWSKVKAAGKEGYVSSRYLTSKNSEANPVKTETSKTISKYVNVKSGSLNLRSNPSTSSQVITSLKKGMDVTVYSEANGWSKVKAAGKEGYVSSRYLTSKNSEANPVKTETSKTISKYVNVKSGALNMRKAPSLNASIIIKLAKGKEVKVLEENKGWSKVEAFGQTGYVSSQYLSSLNPNEPENAQQQTNYETMYVDVSVNSNLNVRKSPATSATVISKLKKGTEVLVSAKQAGWSKIKAGNIEGYVSSQYLTPKKSSENKAIDQEQTTETKYVKVELGSSLNMRNRASTNSSIMVKLPRGLEVTVFSEANGWSKIKAYGKIGYVSSQYLSSNKEGEKQEESSSDLHENTQDKVSEKYVNVMFGSSLNMRSAASTNSSIITKLARGTVVTVYSEENNWARVSANGKTGYVSLQYLSTTKPYQPNTSNEEVEKISEQYDITLSDLTLAQMAANPQTDKKYNTYIREDALTLINSTTAKVKGSSWNVRGGAGTSFWVVGKVNGGDRLNIISKVKGTDGYDWYQVDYNKTWVNASPEDVHYYLNPNNFLSSTVDSLQFLKLSVPANLVASEVNERILAGKGSLEGLASAFITAGETYHVNEIYLISHALLETGNGTSQLSKGVKVNGKTVYNMYGIGAYDGSAISSGAQYAYQAGWFTKEAAIIGGAKFIANGYINKGQDTLYKMRWNPSSSIIYGYASNQYATDISWAAKQVNQIYNLYKLIDSYKLVFDIPAYKYE
ncbi:SH3 domain-containing protein [uncultured Metabacillus sp.]|uniref:SH3 domain-containing protein n=1 Tax=uncultured Metabacillus sp. TaxID=2860135 RepID=UPI002614382B|nr:SH3 domain-containing protein [uncultured Metabacillus sp.]